MTRICAREFSPGLLAGLAAALVSSVAGGATNPDAERPNVLLIVADDMGYADVGFHGRDDIPTPNLDRLAASGVRFSSGYVSGPYCSPTRAGLLTGRYQTRFGHEFNPVHPGDGLPLDQQTIAQRLRTAGYVTGLVGKWHLGAAAELHPLRRGFDEFYGFLGGAHDYFKPVGLFRGTNAVTELDYTTDAFGSEAAAFIQRHKARSWFLCLAFNAVHTPMQATDERLARFAGVADRRRRTYNAMMLAMDQAVGRVLDAVARSGIEKRTLVFFISDNGGPVMRGTSVNSSRNTPFRGGKRTTLEGGIRVPFVMSWPGRLRPGVYGQPVIQLDIAATTLAAAGLELRPEWQLDGVNLLPFIEGGRGDAPHDALFWRFGQQMAVRAGDYKLVRYDGNADTHTGAPNQPVVGPKLYNLTADPGETNDLAAAMPAKVRELQARWDTWNAANIAPRWGGNRAGPDGSNPGTRPAKKADRAGRATARQ